MHALNKNCGRCMNVIRANSPVCAEALDYVRYTDDACPHFVLGAEPVKYTGEYQRVESPKKAASNV